jgi:hypothetical protein
MTAATLRLLARRELALRHLAVHVAELLVVLVVVVLLLLLLCGQLLLSFFWLSVVVSVLASLSATSGGATVIN